LSELQVHTIHYCRYPNRTAAVSTPEGSILQHPSDPDWLCILDKKYASLFFYNVVDGRYYCIHVLSN